MKKIVLFSIVLLFVGTLLGAYFLWTRFVNTAPSNKSEEIIYEVAPGKTFKAVAKELEKKGLIQNSELFILLAKIRSEANKTKVGEYLLNRNMKPSEILSVLVSGKSIEKKLTIAEGLSIFEIADIFVGAGLGNKEEILKYFKDPDLASTLVGSRVTSLEGYLFPETYKYTKYIDYKMIVAEMVEKFKSVYQSVEKEKNPALRFPELSSHQILTLASIIEKETGAPEERPLISSVFHNRMKKGMLLQTDPTVLYGKAMEYGDFEIKISKSDLTKYTPYNTYVIKGLPPGPISNPGRAALEAAMQPAESEYLFFVSHNDGTHQFSKDYSAHQKAVSKFQLNPKAREGKSWRDLKKKQ